jgi:tRNA (cytidine/uridine-2'-O-)-methyltransferase
MLHPHRLKLVLVHPQIAPNTGNIARLCVATGTELHIVRPMGFVLSDSKLKRSAMDYWPRLKLTLHDDLDAFIAAVGSDRVWLMENGSSRTIWQADFADGDWLLFGSETAGLPRAVLTRWADRLIAIPQVPGERCLNVSTAAGIGLFAALRVIAAS